ncbi:hypothetical protein CEXT_407961 [Caerostris extrusa]|uniref:Uncharacterized protein n=1 Tax=Caerostris extrusa TaxID=172846 RepID=A0AAV4PRM0_CAEEX|nr:hypothetical protein CEXT_407961 [Caerostris extrusa]
MVKMTQSSILTIIMVYFEEVFTKAYHVHPTHINYIQHTQKNFPRHYSELQFGRKEVGRNKKKNRLSCPPAWREEHTDRGKPLSREEDGDHLANLTPTTESRRCRLAQLKNFRMFCLHAKSEMDGVCNQLTHDSCNKNKHGEIKVMLLS